MSVGRSDDCDAVTGGAPMLQSALYFTLGMKPWPATSTRGARSASPAGFETAVAPSSGAATEAPPIEFWTGPKPIMRMPFVARAGDATSAIAIATRPSVFFMCHSVGCAPGWSVAPHGAMRYRAGQGDESSHIATSLLREISSGRRAPACLMRSLEVAKSLYATIHHLAPPDTAWLHGGRRSIPGRTLRSGT